MSSLMAPEVRKRKRRILQGYAAKNGLRPEHVPFEAAVQAADDRPDAAGPDAVFDVATYNVHRWTGVKGGRGWRPDLATAVIAELDADVIALQEVLRPASGDDPLARLADDLQLHFAFSPTRPHRRGVLGNAILSRWPMQEVASIDLSFGRLEPRAAIAAQFLGNGNGHALAVVATHLAIVDRIRTRQVRTLLGHPGLQGSVVLLGDMNAWRRCPATRKLDREFLELHDNRNWPPSFPVARPVLALDRVYARGAQVTDVRAHKSTAALKGSDHLPVYATVVLE